MMVTKIWLIVAVILTTLVTFDVYDEGCENVLSGDSSSILNNSCNSYLEYKYEIENEPNLDYVSSVDFYNLSLDDFPFPCDIAQGIFNADSWNICVDSIKSGKESLLNNIIARLTSHAEGDITIDEVSCKFVKGELPDEFSYDDNERKFYCGNSSEDKSRIVNSKKLWNKGLVYNSSHRIDLPPFNKPFLFIDRNRDGYMDVAVRYAGSSCLGSGCGGSGVVILTKKSKEGQLERVLPECETNQQGNEILYDGHWKNLCTSKDKHLTTSLQK